MVRKIGRFTIKSEALAALTIVLWTWWATGICRS